jgi:starch synthase (maltosyl-transferring)
MTPPKASDRKDPRPNRNDPRPNRKAPRPNSDRGADRQAGRQAGPQADREAAAKTPAASGSAPPVSAATSLRPPSRIVIEGIHPEIEAGRFPCKRIAGDPVDVTASIFADGHDLLAAVLRHRRSDAKGSGAPAFPASSSDSSRRDPTSRDSPRSDSSSSDSSGWIETPMRLLGNDRWSARFVVERIGRYEYEIAAWIDRFGTWRHGLARKVDAGLDVRSELLEGAALVEAAARRSTDRADARFLTESARRGAGGGRTPRRRPEAVAAERSHTQNPHPHRRNENRGPPGDARAGERERGGGGAGVEVLPR